MAVKDRTKETLTALIKEYIEPGTTIFSDCWKGYSELEKEGYIHQTVNHSLYFVDPETGASTQNIERCWRDTSATVPKYGRSEHHFDGYLATSIFIRKHKSHFRRFHTFLLTAAELYPPLY